MQSCLKSYNTSPEYHLCSCFGGLCRSVVGTAELNSMRLLLVLKPVPVNKTRCQTSSECARAIFQLVVSTTQITTKFIGLLSTVVPFDFFLTLPLPLSLSPTTFFMCITSFTLFCRFWKNPACLFVSWSFCSVLLWIPAVSRQSVTDFT